MQQNGAKLGLYINVINAMTGILCTFAGGHTTKESDAKMTNKLLMFTGNCREMLSDIIAENIKCLNKL